MELPRSSAMAKMGKLIKKNATTVTTGTIGLRILRFGDHKTHELKIDPGDQTTVLHDSVSSHAPKVNTLMAGLLSKLNSELKDLLKQSIVFNETGFKREKNPNLGNRPRQPHLIGCRHT
jgi:hypothetical protein